MPTDHCVLQEIGYERLERVIDMVGGKWKLRIIYFLAVHGVLRYGELKRRLPSITHKMLSAQLKELVKDGLVVRTEYPQVPPKVEYRLSPMGRDLQPVVEAMFHWLAAHDQSALSREPK